MDPVTIASGLIAIAPSVGRWLFGSDGEKVANEVIGIARQVTGLEEPAQSVERLKVDSDARLAFQKMWQDYELAMYQAETERLRVRLSDTDSARRMQIETKSRMPAVLALSIIVLFAAEQALVMFGYMPKDDASKSVVLGGLKLLELAFSLMLGFYYGSSMQQQRQQPAAAK